MCGIAGIYNFRTSAPIDRGVLIKMVDVIAHRGPDDADLYAYENFGVGFSRLSIIDLSGGAQPMRSIDGRYTLVFNGEIYNYQQIRSELSILGYKFRTQSDAEVILALFEIDDPLPELRLHGMFSFALFDEKNKRLILSRDRLGKKPLFFAETKNGIVFGSEIKSLLCVPEFVRVPNWPMISDFLTLGYCPGPETAFDGVFHVPSGGRLVVDTQIKKNNWWKLPSITEAQKIYSDNWPEQVLETLKQSVRYRLISDVPLGLFLSGGMDSALILSLIAEHGVPKNFKAYTASFDSKSFDEYISAKKIADYYGVKHTKVPIRPDDIRRVFEDVVYKSDNLIGNTAIFPNYLLSEIAHTEVKAVFNGGGGDELFFGYETYRADLLSQYAEKLPISILRTAELFFDRMPTTHQKLGLKYKAKKFLEGMHQSMPKRHYWWRTIFTEDEKDRLLDPSFPRRDTYYAYRNAFERFEGDDFFEMVAYADMQVWWQYMGLYQGDAMSMANSIEMRMPFMDQNLIQLMAQIPRDIKFKDFKLKGLLKDIGRNILPSEVLRRPKSGFQVPLAEWFVGPLRSFLDEYLSPERVGLIPGLNLNYVQQTIDNHYARRVDNSFKLVNLIVLVEWYRRFFLAPSSFK
jgi:asparagine synthase (glutamine-hydrolysing)